MSAWAKPGVKCVCVAEPDNVFLKTNGMSGPILGNTYTIRDVRAFGGGVGVTLEEIVNPPADWANYSGEPFFGLRCFRPLVDISDDVELFRHHLNTVEEPA